MKLPALTQQLRYVNIRLLEMAQDETLNKIEVLRLSLYLSKIIDELEVSK